MGKVEKNSPLYGMSGRVNDIVVVQGKFGPYTRKYNEHIKNGSEAQRREWNKTKKVAKHWNTLKKSEVTAWNEVANDPVRRAGFGCENAISGQLLHNSVNMNLSEAKEDMVRMPSQAPKVQNFTDTKIEIDENKKEMLLDLGVEIYEDTKVLLNATPPLAPGKGSIYTNLIQICVLGASFKRKGSILKYYLEKFGRLPKVTENVGFKIRIVSKESGAANELFILRISYADKG